MRNRSPCCFMILLYEYDIGFSSSDVRTPACFILFFFRGLPQLFRSIVRSDDCHLCYLFDDKIQVLSLKTYLVFLVLIFLCLSFFFFSTVFFLTSQYRRSYVESKGSAVNFLLTFNLYEISPDVKR